MLLSRALASMDTDGRREARRGAGCAELLDVRGRREMGRGGGARRPRLSRLRLSAAAGQEVERVGKMKLGLQKGSVCAFIPQGSIYGLYWTMGRAGNSNEADFF